jgi:sulfur carrier protein
MQKAAVQEKTTIALTVNGERRQVRARAPRELLAELELQGEFFAVAVNRRVITKSRWNDAVLNDGDSVEIVTPRQGG